MDASSEPIGGCRYRAFISYSHRDRKTADWLHRAIETYAVPKTLVGTPGRDGPIPQKLFPVFRDRQELASSADLSASIREALAQSSNLIALCSPDAASSRWVNEEILTFKRMGRADRIFAVIGRGEPHAVAPDRECFPPALRFQLDAAGNLTTEQAEPIAADLRPEGDGKDDAKLKLIAGLLGVSFNDLRQRELIAARRRARTYQGIAAAMLVLAVLAIGGGWMAWRNEQMAESRLQRSITIAGRIVEDVVKLKDRFGVPREAVETLLGSAETSFDELYQDSDDDLRLRQQYAWLLLTFADHYGIIGNIERQSQTMERVRGLLQAITAEEPANVPLQRQLALSEDMAGDALAKKWQLDRALIAYRDSLAIRKRLSTADPQSRDLARDLLISHDKIGDVRRRQGQFASALASYRQALAAAVELAASDPTVVERQRDRLVSHHKIGDILVKQGKATEAADAYRAALTIAESLSAADPGNTQLQRDLAASHDKVGSILVLEGQLASAHASYRASVAIAERLVAADPANAAFQRDLSLAYEKIGDLMTKDGDFVGAAAAYGASLAIREKLAKDDPSNNLFHRDLTVSRNKMGDVLAAEGDWPAALALYRQSLVTRKRLAAIDPSSAQSQRDLSTAHDRVGKALSQLGNLAESLAEHRASLGIAQALGEKDPNNTGWQRDLSIVHANIGDVLARQGNIEAALNSYRASLAVRERLVATEPDDPQPYRDLIAISTTLAPLEEQRNNRLEVHRLYCLVRMAALPLADGDSKRSEWRDMLAEAEERLQALADAGACDQTVSIDRN